MKRIDFGVISYVDDKQIRVNIFEDENQCVNCPLNGHCKSNIELKFNVKKNKKYHIGERVQIEVFYGKKLWIEFLLLGIPIILLVLGVIVGDIIFNSQVFSAIFAAILFMISLVIAIFYIKNKEKVIYKIKEE